MLLVSFTTRAQNLPACDSLAINCCSVNPAGQNTLTLTVENTSSVLFDYPGFALLDSNGDTIAIETVNYFGIGSGPQTHVMNIVAPLTLPFTGSLQLHILFYDSLACTFPVTLPDTVSGLHVYGSESRIPVPFPNPVHDLLFVMCASSYPDRQTTRVTDLHGRILKTWNEPVCQNNLIQLDVGDLQPGIYFLYHGEGPEFTVFRWVKH